MPQGFITKITASKIWLVLSLSLVATLLLAACGDATATVSPTPAQLAARATSATTVVPPTATPLPAPTIRPTATAVPVTAPPLTKVPVTDNLPTPSAAPVTAPATKTPVLKLSNTIVAVGEQVTLSGNNFSANTPLKIEGKSQDKTFTLANLVTDGKGQFSRVVKLDKQPDGTPYQPGDLAFVVTTSANGTASVIMLRLQKVTTATLSVSQPAVKFGTEFTVTGENFPPNTEITLRGGVQNPAVDHGKVKTDGAGKFTLKTSIAKVESAENPYPYPYSFTTTTAEGGFLGYVTVTVTDGSANTLYLVLKVVDNQGAASKMVMAQEVKQYDQPGQTYLVDFSQNPNLALEDGSTGTFETLQPGNIIEFKGAPVPASQRGDVPVIRPLSVRITQ
jgi:hypothetical protein